MVMKGVAGVCKTFQTKLFMVDWAKLKSNKKIDLIVSFHVGALKRSSKPERSDLSLF